MDPMGLYQSHLIPVRRPASPVCTLLSRLLQLSPARPVFGRTPAPSRSWLNAYSNALVDSQVFVELKTPQSFGATSTHVWCRKHPVTSTEIISIQDMKTTQELRYSQHR